MKDKTCEFEQAVVKESARGIPNEKLALHVKECVTCREALNIARWMQNFAREATPKQALPTAGFLWWKSKIIEKQEAGKRAAQPIVWTQTAAIIVLIITALWLAIKYQSIFSSVLKTFSASIELVAAPFLIAVGFATIVCFAFAFKWHQAPKNNL